MHHNYWARALETRSCNCWAHAPRLLRLMHPRAHAPQQDKAAQWEAWTPRLERNPHSRQWEKTPIQLWRPSTAQVHNNIIKKNIKGEVTCIMGFPGGTNDKETAWQCRSHKRRRFDPWFGRSSEGGHSIPLQYSYLENPMDKRSLEGYGTKCHKESDVTEAT